MQNKIQQTVISGIAATIVMTLLMMMGAAMGMPKMSPPDMLAGMTGMPVAMGWVMHFLIGIIFAAGYVFFFNKWLKKISSKMLRGAVYGIIAFVMAQIGFPVMDSIFGSGNMPAPEGSMVLMMTGSVMGHVVFGIVIALLVKSAIPVTKQIIK
ncbi:MAG: hypothetical protein JST58_03380 [Bacteroidetes bacterium]|nr:hypothetical protein [Bacteroidota bacterium]